MLWLLACTGSSDDPSDDSAAPVEDTSSESVCGDAEVETWSADTVKTGDNGLYAFSLPIVDPSPPDKGDNIWTIHVTAGGADVEDATVLVTPFMPAHGHGTSPADAAATSVGSGEYVTDAFDLFMGGVWATTVKATGGAGYDQAVFTFCIEG